MKRSRARSTRNALAGFVYSGDYRRRSKCKKHFMLNLPLVTAYELVLSSFDELMDLLHKSKAPLSKEQLDGLSDIESMLSSAATSGVVAKSRPTDSKSNTLAGTDLESVEGYAPDSKVSDSKSAKAKKSDSQKRKTTPEATPASGGGSSSSSDIIKNSTDSNTIKNTTTKERK